jgi:hypothetical protein
MLAVQQAAAWQDSNGKAGLLATQQAGTPERWQARILQARTPAMLGEAGQHAIRKELWYSSKLESQH